MSRCSPSGQSRPRASADDSVTNMPSQPPLDQPSEPPCAACVSRQSSSGISRSTLGRLRIRRRCARESRGGQQVRPQQPFLGLAALPIGEARQRATEMRVGLLARRGVRGVWRRRLRELPCLRQGRVRCTAAIAPWAWCDVLHWLRWLRCCYTSHRQAGRLLVLSGAVSPRR